MPEAASYSAPYPSQVQFGRSLHATIGPTSQVLLMTICVLFQSPGGTVTQVRALDSGFSTSFVLERLSQVLSLPRTWQTTLISSIAYLANKSSHSIAHFRVWSTHDTSQTFSVLAEVIPKITCDLPLHLILSSSRWKHILGLKMDDPGFNASGWINLLLGVNKFAKVLHNGWWTGLTGTPTAFETHLGLLLLLLLVLLLLYSAQWLNEKKYVRWLW